jgi:hypothetical protein
MTPPRRAEKELDRADVPTGGGLQRAPNRQRKLTNSSANPRIFKANVVQFRERVMPISTGVAERPMCPVCKHRMGLGRISPGRRGFEERTFECRTCFRIKKVLFPVDPMKTDAVGWLASEISPRR